MFIGLFFSFFLSFLTAPSVSKAATNIEDLSARNQKGVVRIGVLFSNNLRFPQWNINSKKHIFEATQKTQTVPVSAIVLGSGFLVNSAGYIVTNAHVVDISGDKAAEVLWEEYQAEVYGGLSKDLSDQGFTQAEIDDFYTNLIDYIGKNGTWDQPTYQIAVFNPEQKYDSFEEYIKHGFIAEIKKTGEPYPRTGKDVAILKIQPNQYFQSIALGSSENLQLGTSLYAMGYPGIADIDSRGLTEPTLTSGVVSSIKPATTGDYKLIQIDATISGGNSGGPVFNGNGEVIGIATLKTSNTDSYNFILPVELAKEYLSELNVAYQTKATSQFGQWLQDAFTYVKQNPLIDVVILLAIGMVILFVIMAVQLRRARKNTINIVQTAITPVVPTASTPPVTGQTPSARPPL